MSLACAYAVALVGLDGRIVEVEAHTGPGLPRTILVGLPDTSLYEARDRCKAAVHSSGRSWPSTLLTISNAKNHQMGTVNRGSVTPGQTLPEPARGSSASPGNWYPGA